MNLIFQLVTEIYEVLNTEILSILEEKSLFANELVTSIEDFRKTSFSESLETFHVYED